MLSKRFAEEHDGCVVNQTVFTGDVNSKITVLNDVAGMSNGEIGCLPSNMNERFVP